MLNQQHVVFITGAFVSHTTWDRWISLFSSNGYKAIAPPWPFKNASAAALRNIRPDDTGLAELTLTGLVKHYENIVKSLPEKPVIIGHSLGGLIAQILINRGLGTAGVAIHPVAPQGVFPYEFTFLRATWKLLGIFSSTRKTHMVSFEDFSRTFANGLSKEEQHLAYDLYAIPESRTVARGGLTNAAAVDFNKPHVPLLITSGGKDQLIPAHLNFRNFKRYSRQHSVTDYCEFPESTHGILTNSNWRDEADFILDWLNENEVRAIARQIGRQMAGEEASILYN
ncbi:alpha/beta hydrolase [Terrimonas sp. NA20]|uniref:Alpha/beta hydrolase n=1 Tax=Terrimonas ginsenosidimutans TaxID=2908004 RepID=A0ABS9KRY6_9BACT|nr:alpha/beta hydrolase [Terrimonas ginsenosidimutans]MCG2615095.1 alpha/beta hydrolase [Terrimonas ginsenosidimutans]